MSMKNHGGMISAEENSLFVHQSSLAILPAESSSSEAGGTGEGKDEFCVGNGSLTCLTIL
jgi:hypothetical protein